MTTNIKDPRSFENIDDLAAAYGSYIVGWLMENFGCDCDNETEALECVANMLNSGFIGVFSTREEAGRAVLQHTNAELADALADRAMSGLFNYVGYLTRCAGDCAIHMHLGEDGKLYIFTI